MLNIPFAFIGSVAALWITGLPFNVASLVGFISLCGVASRNGVLMISHYMHLIAEEGMPFGRDMVIRGSQERVAPVLMTALTAGIGLAPLALAAGQPGKELLYPVAVVVIGGLVTSTILDFFVTPTVFLRFAGNAARRALERRKLGTDVLAEHLGVPQPSEALAGATGAAARMSPAVPEGRQLVAHASPDGPPAPIGPDREAKPPPGRDRADAPQQQQQQQKGDER